MNIFNHGVWPTMITPYTESRQIDWKSLDEMIEWYIASGVSGLFSVCLSSEILHLAEDEKIKLAKYVVKRVNGRVPVVSGILHSDNVLEKIKEVYDTGVEAVIFLANQLFPQNQDSKISLNNITELISKIDNIPLGIYESPLPFHKIVTADELKTINSSNRLYFMKDTSSDIDKIKEKLKITVGTNCNFYNANTPTLLESLKLGGAGYSGIASNYYPELYAWLCINYKSEPKLVLELADFLTIADNLISHKYLIAAKVFQKLDGRDLIPISRASNDVLTSTEISSLKSLHRTLKIWHNKLKI